MDFRSKTEIAREALLIIIPTLSMQDPATSDVQQANKRRVPNGAMIRLESRETGVIR